MNSKYSAKFVFFRDNTLSICLKVKSNCCARCLLPVLKRLCTNSASYEYKNKSASNGAQLVSIGMLRKTGSDISTTLIQGFNFMNSRFQLHEFTISTSRIHDFNFTNSTSRIHEFNFTNSRIQLHEFTNSISRIPLHEFNFTNSTS